MGWLSSSEWRTKGALIAHLEDGYFHPEAVRTLAKAVRGNTLWTVIEYLRDTPSYPAGTRGILCFLMRAYRGEGWGYKDMDESMGPSDESCPVKFLDMVPDPGGYATAWRARVRARSTTHLPRIKVGDRLLLHSTRVPHVTVTALRPLAGTFEGTTYTVPRRLIARVLPQGESA
jgi:hypothetical protein